MKQQKSTKTLSEFFRAVGDSAYWGDRANWLVAYSAHRDAQALERSNWRCFGQALRALPTVRDWSGEDLPIAEERASHWAVGWIDYLLVNPACPEAVAEAERLLARLEDYPVLDEFDFSEEETNEANEVWRECYRPKDRLKYIRENRSQFKFRSFSDLLSCMRGQHFAGYASELLG